MDKIDQLINSKRIALGWYGICEEDCVTYDLTHTDNQVEVNKIDHVYEINGTDSSRPVFYSTYAEHSHGDGITQSMTKLHCGRAYYVVLKKGEETLHIPGFEFTDSNTNDDLTRRVTSECPPEWTPTPTHTPSPTFTWIAGPQNTLSKGSNITKTYTEYDVDPANLEGTTHIESTNTESLTMVATGATDAWTYNGQPFPKDNSNNIEPVTLQANQKVDLTFALNSDLLAGNGSNKEYKVTLTFTSVASEKDSDGGNLYQNKSTSITLTGNVRERKVTVGHSFTINANSKTNTFSVGGTIAHTRCPNSLYKWTTQKTAASNATKTIIEDFGNTELTGGGNKNVSFNLDLEDNAHLAFFETVSDTLTETKFKAYFTLSAYGIHETVRDTDYETYQDSNQNYSIKGQVTPIDSHIDDGGYEVVHPDFYIAGQTNTGSRAAKIYTLDQSVTMAPGASTSESPSGGIQAVLVRHWVKEAKLVSVTAQESSHASSLDAWEMTDLSSVPDADVEASSVSWLPASSESNANKNVMDVENFDFRLKSGLTEADNYNIKATFTGTTIKGHDITITLNLNGEIIAVPGPLIINDLWISFAKVDPQAWYFSDFLEVRGAEAENINRYEVTGPVKSFNEYNKDAAGNGLIQNGTKFDKTKHIDSENYNPFASDPLDFIKDYFSTYEDMINAFHDTVVFTGEGDIGGRNEKWYIDFVTEFDYTKFKIIDENFTAENFTFDKTISHAFLVKSSTKPPFQVGTTNNTFETSFNAVGEISLKCDDTWNYDAEPKTNLIFLGNKEHKFTDVWSTEDDATQSGLTDKTDAMQTPWLGGKMSLSANASNTIDSALGTNNVFSIKEFYFQKVGQESPIKFGEGNPKGSHC